MTAVRDLHGWRALVAVASDDLAAEPLEFDDDFLAEFARTEQKHAGGAGRVGSAEGTGDEHAAIFGSQ